jgi:hypothetical protein
MDRQVQLKTFKRLRAHNRAARDEKNMGSPDIADFGRVKM